MTFRRVAAIAAALLIAPAGLALAADVGVSISVGQPGFYGRIDIGNAPPPQVVYPQPVVIAPVAVAPEPIYLRVPPGHQKRWGRYCRRYNACDRPVYFVRDGWYNEVYVPHYREHHEEWRDRDRGPEQGRGHGRGRDDDRRDRDDDRGEHRGHGHGRD